MSPGVIDLLSRKLAALQQQKKGLVQLLVTGRVSEGNHSPHETTGSSLGKSYSRLSDRLAGAAVGPEHCAIPLHHARAGKTRWISAQTASG